jgi:hypothetical protein
MDYSADLSQAFGFDTNDLAFNRHNKLSPKQRERLDMLYQSRRNWGWQTFAIILGVMIFALVIALLSGGTTLEELRIAILPVSAMLGGLFLISALYTRWHNGRLRAGKIRVIEGNAKPRKYYARYGWVYQVKIGRRALYLENERQFEAFMKGEKYRVYLVDVTPVVVLSVEKLVG